MTELFAIMVIVYAVVRIDYLTKRIMKGIRNGL